MDIPEAGGEHEQTTELRDYRDVDGVKVGEAPEAPLPKSDRPLRWDAARGMRVRK